MKFRLDLFAITVTCFALYAFMDASSPLVWIVCFCLPTVLTIYFSRYWGVKSLMHAWLTAGFVLAPAVTVAVYPISGSWLNKLIAGVVLFLVLKGTPVVLEWARASVPADSKP